MPQITLKETITKRIEIPMDTLCKIIDNLSDADRKRLLIRLKKKPGILEPFRKDKVSAILKDFTSTDLYEKDFLKDLEAGLKKSSFYR